MDGRPFKHLDVICLTDSLQIRYQDNRYQDNFTQKLNSSEYARKSAIRSGNWHPSNPLTFNLNDFSRLNIPTNHHHNNLPLPKQPYTP